MCFNPEPIASCDICSAPLCTRSGWWHRCNSRGDLCYRHYQALGRGQRKLFSEINQACDLGMEVDHYRAAGIDWWAGHGAVVAVLSGGPMFQRPHGSDIQACDASCVSATELLLRSSGYNVMNIDISDLGSPSAEGDTARANLVESRCIVLPGGHDVPQAAALGDAGRMALATACERGVGLVGVCAGAWLLSFGDGQSQANFGWLPVFCDPAFGDNSLTGMVRLDASDVGQSLLGDGLCGQVKFDESPSMLIDRSLDGADGLSIDATYAAPGVCACDPRGIAAVQRFGTQMDSLIGGAAVIRGHRTLQAGDDTVVPSRGRVVLIGPHFELSDGVAKRHVLVRAVAWAIGRNPGCAIPAE